MLELVRRFHSWSLNTIQGRFLVITVFLLLVGGLLAVLPLAALIYDEREQETYKHVNEALDRQEQALSRWKKEQMEELSSLASFPQSRSSLLAQIEHIIENDSSFFEDLSVIDADGRIAYSANRSMAAELGNVADRPYAQFSLKGEAFTSDVIRRQSDGEPVIVISSPLLNERGQIVGALSGTVPLDRVWNAMNALSFSETARLYVADESGMLLFPNATEDTVSLAQTELFRQANKGMAQAAPYENINGERVIGQYRWVHDGQWLLVGEVSTKEMSASFWRTIGMMAAILLFVFGLAWCVIRLLVRQIMQPIHQLLEATVILRLGNYTHRIPDSSVEQSLGEFKALKGAYNEMARSLEQEFSLRIQAEKELRQANEMLTRLSLSDSLTGIGNRRYFDDVLELTWEAAIDQKKPMSLLLLDIDFFKKYNDRYGHDAGDRALCRVSEAVDTVAKEAGAVAARYGGEELAVIIPPGISAESFGLAEKIRRSIEHLCIMHEDTKSGIITVSVGGATILPKPDEAPTLLIRKADEALYYSKRKGRARSTTYESITP